MADLDGFDGEQNKALTVRLTFDAGGTLQALRRRVQPGEFAPCH